MAVSKVNMESLENSLAGKECWDVVGMRTTASSWKPSRYGPHGELLFFHRKKESTSFLRKRSNEEHIVGNLLFEVVQGWSGWLINLFSRVGNLRG